MGTNLSTLEGPLNFLIANTSMCKQSWHWSQPGEGVPPRSPQPWRLACYAPLSPFVGLTLHPLPTLSPHHGGGWASSVAVLEVPMTLRVLTAADLTLGHAYSSVMEALPSALNLGSEPPCDCFDQCDTARRTLPGPHLRPQEALCL